MKKTLTILALIIFASCTQVKAQQKKDTTIQITVTLDQFRALIYTIDQNIDSKKTSKDIVDFLQKSAQIVADKPKQKQ